MRGERGEPAVPRRRSCRRAFGPQEREVGQNATKNQASILAIQSRLRRQYAPTVNFDILLDGNRVHSGIHADVVKWLEGYRRANPADPNLKRIRIVRVTAPEDSTTDTESDVFEFVSRQPSG
jgi:hypothetical protein